MRAWDGRLRFSELTPHKVCDWKCGLQLEKQLARSIRSKHVLNVSVLSNWRLSISSRAFLVAFQPMLWFLTSQKLRRHGGGVLGMEVVKLVLQGTRTLSIPLDRVSDEAGT